MNFRRIIIIILITLNIISCSNKNESSIKRAGFNHFKISIEQDGQERYIINHEVILDKKTFTIVISFIGADTIFVNASFVPESFIAARNGKNLNGIIGFEGTGIADELFNRDEILMISNKSPNFWHYANENEHRFNEITEKSGIITCKRTISNIINIDASKKKINISRIKKDAIYLIFMKLVWNKAYSRRIEEKREYLKLTFTK